MPPARDTGARRGDRGGAGSLTTGMAATLILARASPPAGPRFSDGRRETPLAERTGKWPRCVNKLWRLYLSRTDGAV